MEAASSTDESSSSEEEIVQPIQSLDDLPSDDSVSLDSSSSDEEEEQHDKDSDDSSQSDDNSSDNDDNGDKESDSDNERGLEDLPLEERLLQKREAGMSHSVRAEKRDRKSRALELASQRLATASSSSSSSAAKDDKKSKNKPTEASSRRSDFFKRGAPQLNSSGVGVEIGAHRYKPRDPRMALSSVDPGQVDRNYEFLQELRNQEIATLKKQIAIRKLSGKKGQKARRKLGLHQGSLQEDQAELSRLQEEKVSYERKQLERKAKQAVKKKLRDNVAAGKGVYYLKKREMKKMQLEEKFEEIRKRGGDAAVDKAVAKRRKKNKSKDTGFMPKES